MNSLEMRIPGELKLEWIFVVDNGSAEQPTKASPGSKEHRANMGRIAEEIRGCIIFKAPYMHFVESSLATSFFTDRDELQTFLDLSEQDSFSQPSTLLTEVKC